VVPAYALARPFAPKSRPRNLFPPCDVLSAGLTCRESVAAGLGGPAIGRDTEFPMSILISLLITILVIGLVLYLVRMLPLDAQIKNIVQIIVIVIGIISLLRYLAVF
jgi:hypothetical protein